MFIWLALLIPLLTAAILATFFHHRTVWWEFAIPFVASLLLVAGSKAIAGYAMTQDTEIWNDFVTQAQYHEDWNEYVHQTCTRQNCTGFGKDQSCTTEFYDCSYVAYHAEEWKVFTEAGDVHGVTQQTYNYFVKLFGHQPIFKDMARHYHTNDGDMYYVNWPRTRETIEPVNTAHTYENRVQASRSVFNYEKISEKDAKALGLFDYPEVSLFNYPSVLGDCGPDQDRANQQLRVSNAMMGREKQLRMWVLCTRNADMTFAQKQEAYWVGGNKNEVVAVVSLNQENNPNWIYLFSWAADKTPLIETRDQVMEMKPFSVLDMTGVMAINMQAKFKRRPFSDFSYLSVEPPPIAYWITFLLTLVLNIGLSYYIIVNEHSEESPRERFRRRYYQ